MFLEAFQAGDAERLVDMYESDAVFVPQPGVTVQGRDAIRAAIQAFLATKMSMDQLESKQVVVNGDIAFLSCHWILNGRNEEGQPVTMSGTTDEVVRRGADGLWRYVIDNPWGA